MDSSTRSRNRQWCASDWSAATTANAATATATATATKSTTIAATAAKSAAAAATIKNGLESLSFLVFWVGALLFLGSACTSTSETLRKKKKWPPAFYVYQVEDLKKNIIEKEEAKDVPFTPASCLKVITALLALEDLGSDFQFQTELYSIRRHGKIEALRLKGYGDPTLTSENVKTLLKKYQKKSLPKGFILDLSEWAIPPHSNNIMTGDIGRISGRPVMSLNLNQNLFLDQTLSPREPVAFLREEISKILHELKIQAKISFIWPGEKKAQQKNDILEETFLSGTLKELLPPMMKRSDNLFFDTLYLSLVYRKKKIEDWHEGDPIIKDLLAKYFKADFKEALIIDGSGLSRYNRLTAEQLLTVLRHGQHNTDFLSALIERTEKKLPFYHRIKTGRMLSINCQCGYLGSEEPDKAFIFHAQNFSVPSREITKIGEEFMQENH
jgi:serine-type D-Ala-D-Ala carboxypeptidase/endopeptidase (penicillin-binding protein 4)